MKELLNRIMGDKKKGTKMSNIKITELKKYLSNSSDEELRGEIVGLFKLFPEVKEYYSLKLKPEAEKELMNKFKKIIENEFFPDRGFGKLRYSIMKKALEDFRKLSHTPEYIAELMVSQVEYGVEFTNEYGDINERFYSNIAVMYDKALEYISKENLELTFKDRLRKIMVDGDGIGWGFSDELRDLYYSHFDD